MASDRIRTQADRTLGHALHPVLLVEAQKEPGVGVTGAGVWGKWSWGGGRAQAMDLFSHREQRNSAAGLQALGRRG